MCLYTTTKEDGAFNFYTCTGHSVCGPIKKTCLWATCDSVQRLLLPVYTWDLSTGTHPQHASSETHQRHVSTRPVHLGYISQVDTSTKDVSYITHPPSMGLLYRLITVDRYNLSIVFGHCKPVVCLTDVVTCAARYRVNLSL